MISSSLLRSALVARMRLPFSVELAQFEVFFRPPSRASVTYRRRSSANAASVDAASTDADDADYTLYRRQGMRCLAIVAHVDHGKTSLVDQLLQTSRQGTASSLDRLLDSSDLEKERGITITSKVTRLIYKSADEDVTTIVNIADSTLCCSLFFPGGSSWSSRRTRSIAPFLLTILFACFLFIHTHTSPWPRGL
jgi:hypothetical protein